MVRRLPLALGAPAAAAEREERRKELHAEARGGGGALAAALEDRRVPCAKVIAPIDALGHPHFESREMIRRVDDPVLGEVVIPGSPLRLSEQPDQLELQAPLLGQHNEEILAQLGYDNDAVTALGEAGVLHAGDT